MNPDDFEKRLQSQPLRRLPKEWRSEIMQQASTPDILARQIPPVREKAARHSFLSTLNHLLSTILWPNPKAWAGLGCVWILIFVLQAASRGSSPMLAQVPTPQSVNVMLTLKDREQTLVELIGNNAPSDAAEPPRFNPLPHSERHVATAMA